MLRGLTLDVAAGETVALVGTAGSGKSTIAQLLPRFYDVTGGALRVAGRDVRELATESLRGAIGLVSEDSFLFSDTVSANISYGRPTASRAEIEAAAQAAEADGFISELPQGYDTVIGEQGLTLSGGQRQRVALARALLTDPRILVLDDATSAVDPRVEAEIHARLREVMAGRTTLLIAHRRSTLQLADRIAVLDAGRLVDCGTHEELDARCPLYRELIAGPDDDAEGMDSVQPDVPLPAGPVPASAPAAVAPAAPAQSPGLTGLPGASRPGGRVGARGRTGGRGGGGGAGLVSMMAGVPASPELLAQVDALPPATETPDVDLGWASAPAPRFSLRQVLRPFAIGLIIGLVLDALDALASIAMPALVRGGIDHGVQTGVFRAVLLISGLALAIVLADWVINAVQTVVVGRNGERVLYALRVKIFAQLQRLGLDFYEREMSGRIMTRMTTDVDALSSFLQTGLITMVNSGLSFLGVLIALLFINLRLGLTVLTLIPLVAVATLVFRARSSRAYAEAREKVAAVNADLQENVAGLRVAQAYRREAVNLARFAALSTGLPPVPAARAALHRDLLPVRPVAVHRGQRAHPAGRGRADAQRPAHRGRAGRLPALHRHAVLPGAAAVPGVRRVPAGRGRAAPDRRPAAHADQHAAGHPARPAHPGPGPDRVPRRPVQLPGQPAARAGRGEPDHRRRARRSPWSARPGRASPPWSSWWPGSTT